MAVEDAGARSCLQDIIKLDLETKAIIQDIRNYADCQESLDILSRQAREIISNLRAKVNDLEQFGLEENAVTDREAILTNVRSLRQGISGILGSLRQASLNAQLSIDRKIKEDLFCKPATVIHRLRSSKGALAKMATDVTDNLSTLNRSMARQVGNSEANRTMIVNSSSSLGEVHHEFHDMGSQIENSHRLLTKYRHRELTDKLLICLALTFFFGTVLYILKVRLLSS